MIVSGELLLSYLKSKPPLVESVSEDQIQPNGIDLSIDKIFRFKGSGSVRVIDRKLADVVEMKPDRDGWWHLGEGAYKVRIIEIVHIPIGLIGIARPRSTLTRCGAMVHTALWDSGYEGKSEVLLTVHNHYGLNIQKGARIMQIIFLLCEGNIDKGYNGLYQGENI
ncbi:MAG: deoxyuridine 5'-triphosphate nucleotidohydrolase [bacterium]